VTTSEVAGEIWVQRTTSTSITYLGDPLLLSGESYYWKVSTYTNDPWDINSISGVRRFTIR